MIVIVIGGRCGVLFILTGILKFLEGTGTTVLKMFCSNMQEASPASGSISFRESATGQVPELLKFTKFFIQWNSNIARDHEM